MTRARRPEDWDRDLSNARASEQRVGAALEACPQVCDVADNTASMDRLDFSFTYQGAPVELDVKEKRQPYSKGIQDLWPQVPETYLFIVDETVFRRIVWQGVVGYLAIHDIPCKDRKSVV